MPTAPAGVCLILGARVTAVSCQVDGVSVESVGHPVVRARACVLACGGRYALHRQLGLTVPSLFLHTAQREVPAAHPGDVEVHFGSEVAPKGFGWAVPIRREGKSYARIGVMSQDRSPVYFDRMVARVAERWGVQTPADGPRARDPPSEPHLAHLR
jgi:flavin-dependent dehydrogenase